DGGEAHGDFEQVHRDIVRHVDERLVMRFGDDQHVSRVDGLDVHEGEGRCVLITNGHLRRAPDEVAEDAMRIWLGHGSRSRQSVPSPMFKPTPTLSRKARTIGAGVWHASAVMTNRHRIAFADMVAHTDLEGAVAGGLRRDQLIAAYRTMYLSRRLDDK